MGPRRSTPRQARKQQPSQWHISLTTNIPHNPLPSAMSRSKEKRKGRVQTAFAITLAGNNQTFCGRMGLNGQPRHTCLGSAAFVEHCNGNGWVKNEPKSSESSVGDRPQVVFFQASVHLSGGHFSPFLSLSLSHVSSAVACQPWIELATLLKLSDHL